MADGVLVFEGACLLRARGHGGRGASRAPSRRARSSSRSSRARSRACEPLRRPSWLVGAPPGWLAPLLLA